MWPEKTTPKSHLPPGHSAGNLSHCSYLTLSMAMVVWGKRNWQPCTPQGKTFHPSESVGWRLKKNSNKWLLSSHLVFITPSSKTKQDYKSLLLPCQVIFCQQHDNCKIHTFYLVCLKNIHCISEWQMVWTLLKSLKLKFILVKYYRIYPGNWTTLALAPTVLLPMCNP